MAQDADAQAGADVPDDRRHDGEGQVASSIALLIFNDDKRTLWHLAFLFSTFLYGAVVHLLLAHSNAKPITWAPALAVLGLTVFVFSDWSSRTRLPTEIPDVFPPHLLMVKVLLEIVGAVFLTISFIAIIEDRSAQDAALLGPEAAFAMYLLATWLWDMLMVYVMSELDMKTLVPALFAGTVMDMEGVDRYLGRFRQWKQSRAEDLTRRITELQDETRREPGRLLGLAFHQVRSAWFEGIVAALLQFLGNHTAWCNLGAGAAILGGAIRGDFKALVPGASLVPTGPVWLWTVVAGLAVTLIACGIGGRRWGGAAVGFCLVAGSLLHLAHSEFVSQAIRGVALVGTSLCLVAIFFSTHRPRARQAGALLVVGMLIGTYLLLPAHQVALVLASQQVLVNLFLQLSVRRDRAHPERVERTSVAAQKLGDLLERHGVRL